MTKSTKIISATLILLLLFGLLLRYILNLLPTQQSDKPNFDESASKFERVVFVGSNPTVPADVFHYTATLQPGNLETIANHILTTDTFVQNTYVPTVYSSESSSFQIIPEENKVTYSYNIDSLLESEDGNIPIGMDEDEVKQVALEKFSTLFATPTENLEVGDIFYITQSESATYVKPERALYAIVFINQTINGIPLITNFVGHSYGRVVLNSEMNLLTAEIRPITVTTSNPQAFPTLSIPQAVTQINQNNAFVANAAGDGLAPVDLSVIRQARLQSVRLEYFSSNSITDQTLKPYYRFTGGAVNNKGQSFTITILTPATKQ